MESARQSCTQKTQSCYHGTSEWTVNETVRQCIVKYHDVCFFLLAVSDYCIHSTQKTHTYDRSITMENILRKYKKPLSPLVVHAARGRIKFQNVTNDATAADCNRTLVTRKLIGTCSSSWCDKTWVSLLAVADGNNMVCTPQLYPQKLVRICSNVTDDLWPLQQSPVHVTPKWKLRLAISKKPAD